VAPAEEASRHGRKGLEGLIPHLIGESLADLA
jgi:hypothetical protein